jgi:hypothetical protein
MGKVEQLYTVVEIEKTRPVDLSPEAAASVESLQGHAGFLWLLSRLKYQAARLRTELETVHHEDIREVDFLQSGLFWCNWLQQQLDIGHNRYISTRPANSVEHNFMAQIEPIIGHKPYSSNE